MKKWRLGRTILVFMLMILISVLISTMAVSYTTFSNKMINEIGKSRTDVLRQVSERIEQIQDHFRMASNLYYYSEPIQELIANAELPTISIHALCSRMDRTTETVHHAMQSSMTEFGYFIAFADGRSIQNGAIVQDNYFGGMKRLLWYADILQNGTELTLAAASAGRGSQLVRQDIVGARCLLAPDGTLIGILGMYIPESVICETYETVLDHSEITVMNERGQIISSKNKERIGFSFYNMERLSEIFADSRSIRIDKNGSEYLFSICPIGANWNVVEEIPLKVLLTPVKDMRKSMLLCSALALLLAVAASGFFAWKTEKPLRTLCDGLQRVGKGDLEHQIEADGWKEVHDVALSSNQMIGRIKELILDIHEKELEKRRAELDFLQAQIQPHFIHNTLFSIKCLISMNRNEEAENMLQAFMHLLNNALKTDSEFVAIADEIALLQDYIAITKQRFGDIFDFSVECPAPLSACLIPRFLIQPLVENSIVHGVLSANRRCYVSVRVEEAKEGIRIIVEDNGSGITEDRLWAINHDAVAAAKTVRSHRIGIQNIRDRIQLHFGERYGLYLESRPDELTRISFTIPLLGRDNPGHL